MSRPRYQKLVEFVANSGEVRCVRIGRKSAGVVATGGDDKKVNVWTLGRTSAIVSLVGHNSAIESVTFDKHEECVASGGSNGSIKVFELEVAKVTRSLSGHKANVGCLEFHPFGDSLISGSMDTNLKHWDMRASSAVLTFKGHNAPVTHAKFSPDGKWVASGSADGAVKVWDLTAGRLVADLQPPTKYEVTGLEYHPFEFLLASSTRDKVIRFFDLETFRCVEQTPPEATPVRNIAFHPDGKYIFSILQDAMRVWSWEPVSQHDYLDVPWSRLADLATSNTRGQRLIGCSFTGSVVGVFSISLRNIRPFCEDPVFMAREDRAGTGASVDAGNPYEGGGGRSSAAALPPVDNMRNMNLNQRLGPAPAAPAPVPRYADASSSIDAKPNGRTPEPLPAAMLPPRHSGSAGPSSSRYAGAAGSSQDLDGHTPPAAPPAAVRASSETRPPMKSIGIGVGDSLMRGQAGEPPPQPVQRQRSYGESRSVASGRDVPVEVHAPAYQAPAPRREAPPPAPRDEVRPPWQTANDGAEPSGRPPTGGSRQPFGGGGGGYPSTSGMSEWEVLSDMGRRHQEMRTALALRGNSLTLLRNFIARSDWRGAVNCAKRCNDPGTWPDLLAVLQARKDAYHLSLVGEVSAMADMVLSSPSDRHVQLALETIGVQVHAFGQLIQECSAPMLARGVGIDLKYQERRDMAQTAKQALQNLLPKVNAVSRRTDDLGKKAREVSSQLSQL